MARDATTDVITPNFFSFTYIDAPSGISSQDLSTESVVEEKTIGMIGINYYSLWNCNNEEDQLGRQMKSFKGRFGNAAVGDVEIDVLNGGRSGQVIKTFKEGKINSNGELEFDLDFLDISDIDTICVRVREGAGIVEVQKDLGMLVEYDNEGDEDD